MHPIIKNLTETVIQSRRQKIREDIIRNMLKEELQDYILMALYNHKDTRQLIFYGGTCLRKLYKLDRMSEDLDFEAIPQINHKTILRAIESYFKSIDFDKIVLKPQSGKQISRVTCKFPILFDLGISSMKEEKIHVKVEYNNLPINKYPVIQTSYMSNQVSMLINHYDLPTLMAGKINACLNRTYRKGDSNITFKGRDYYDLIWYMQKKIKPNPKKLIEINKKHKINNIWKLLDKQVSSIKPAHLLIDLEPFFANQEYIKNWTNHFREFYKRYRP